MQNGCVTNQKNRGMRLSINNPFDSSWDSLIRYNDNYLGWFVIIPLTMTMIITMNPAWNHHHIGHLPCRCRRSRRHREVLKRTCELHGMTTRSWLLQGEAWKILEIWCFQFWDIQFMTHLRYYIVYMYIHYTHQFCPKKCTYLCTPNQWNPSVNRHIPWKITINKLWFLYPEMSIYDGPARCPCQKIRCRTGVRWI